MSQTTMYSAAINSPSTTLNGSITDIATSITVTDGSKLPNAPNLLTIGTGEDAETILMTEKSTNTLTVTRGVQGTAKAWDSDEVIARTFTAYDHDTFKSNIEDLDSRIDTFDSNDITDYAEDADSHSGLDFYYKAGRVRSGTTVSTTAAGHVTLADDDTSYIEVDPADGTVSDNVTGFTVGKVPLFEVVTASGAIDTATDKRAFLTPSNITRGVCFSINNVDLTTDMTIAITAPCALKVIGGKIEVGTAPTGANLICDVHKNGTTLWTTQDNRPTIADAGTNAAITVPDVTIIAQGDRLLLMIDQVGSTVAGKDLSLTLYCEAV